MGLLTDPNTGRGSWLSTIIIKHHTALSWLCYVAGIIFLLVLPHPIYNGRTYFSENALLPGLVTGEFNEERSADRYLESLKEENAKYPGTAPFPWLEAQFKQLGLDVYTHHFTLDYPLANKSFSGSNVYAILRAPKAASTEAVVLTAPHRHPNSPLLNTDAGLAVLLSSAKFFRKQIYWAKDIIFLVTQHEFLGMQAWLEAYHGVTYGEGCLKAGQLPGRAGSIQAAINLELSSPRLTHLNVKVEGLNGQLPNLDLVNLVNRLAAREGVHQMFHGVEDHPRAGSYNGYMRSLKTMLNMMTTQATGVPSGNHGLFHRFGIEALTLEGVTMRKKGRMQADFLTLGRVIEGTFRSLNNLLERFHQSFFFYILPSGSRYVSIGLYMPMFGLLAGGFLISALGLWFGQLVQPNSSNHRIPSVIPSSLSSTLPVVIACHLLGLLAAGLPKSIARLGSVLDLEPDDSVVIGLAGYSLVLLLLPILPRPNLRLPPNTWRMTKCILCLELAALASCTSLCNISLAVLVTLLYLPLTLLVVPRKGARKVVVGVISVLCHPLLLAGIAASLDTARAFPKVGLGELMVRAGEAWRRGIMYSIVDGYIYGNVLWQIGSTFLLPAWLMLYLLNFCEQDDVALSNEEVDEASKDEQAKEPVDNKDKKDQ